MEKIKIYHAFNGFLYAPIFLAERLGFFPQNTQLVYTTADSKTIEELCRYSDSEKNWFAICDPFSVDIGNSYPTGTNDRICIIGSLINVLPFWVFNPDQTIHGAGREEDLKRYQNSFTKIIVYPQGTTGYLIGKRVQSILGLNDRLIEQRNFGEEFNGRVTNTEVVITADVLRVVYEGLDTHNVLLDYPTRSPNNLYPYLFTAILTLQTTVDSNLWTVLAVLGAIQAAINCLSAEHVKPEYINTLVEIFDTPKYGDSFRKIGLNTQQEKAELVQRSLTFLFRTQKIYTQYPKPVNNDDWVKAWTNAKNLWVEFGALTDDSTQVTEQDEPIPSLLVRREWKPMLADYYHNLLSPNTPNTQGVEYQRRKHLSRTDLRIIQGGVGLGVLALVFIGFAYHVAFNRGVTEATLNAHHIAVLIFVGSLLFTAVYFVCLYYYWRAVLIIDSENKSILVTIATSVIGCLIGALFYLASQ